MKKNSIIILIMVFAFFIIAEESIAAPDNFVSVSGTDFYLNGMPFYFAGANAYYIWYGNWDCVTYDKNQGCSKEVLDDAKALNLTVLRVWGFADGSNYWGSLQPSAGVYSEASFQKFDRLVKEAGDRGLKLIIPLVNNWGDFGGMDKYVSWCSGTSHDQFYTMSCTKDLYKNYVNYFLNRVNTLTGIKYKDDPTILAWELANEPRCRSDITGATLNNWIGEMSAYIKSIDSNHLVTTGVDGGYVNKGSNPFAWWYKGNEGQDYYANHNWASVDFATFHYYQDMDPSIVPSVWIQEHIDDAHNIIGKPVLFEEFNSNTNRLELLNNWYKQMEINGVNGNTIWMLADKNYMGNSDGYFVSCPDDDEVCRTIAGDANYMNAKTAGYGINRAPIIAPLSKITVSETQLVDINATGQLKAYDLDGDAITFSFSAPLDASGKWQTKAGDGGAYAVKVTASDGMATDTKTVIIEVLGNKKPLSTGHIQVIQRDLYLDGNEFTIKGVGYAPVPIGSGAGTWPDTAAIYDRDFSSLKKMNANAVRTWGSATPLMLDRANAYGIYVIAGFWIDYAADLTNPTVRSSIITSFSNYVTQLKDKPALLMWAIGNENNYHNDNAALYSLANDMAKAAYSIEGASYHPVAIVNGEIATIGSSALGSTDTALNYTDIWGANIYRGKSFNTLFSDYAVKSKKPLWISEYGVDSLNHTSLTEYQNVQADYANSLWNELKNSNVSAGGTIMAYSDEWWKAGSYSTHDAGGYAIAAQPDGFSDEEYWGVMSIESNGTNPNIMHPKKEFYILRDNFRGYNNKPVVNANDVTVTEGDLVKINPNATDPDGDDLTITFSSPLNSSGQWQTHFGDAGDYIVTMIVSDGSLTDTKLVYIHVSAAPITCSANSDCGTDGWIGSPSCNGNNVWQNYRTYTCSNPGTPSSSCSYSDVSQLKQTCSANQVCSSGVCVDVACSSNSQCGTDGWIGSPSCNGNSVYQDYRKYTCNNPGTASSSCSSTDTNNLITTCTAGQYCSNGQCIDAVCSSNSDCETDSWVGTDYCNGNEVWNTWRTFTCSNPGTASASCSQSDSDKTKQTCADICSAGKCIYSEPGLLFYEPFDSIAEVTANGGVLNNGAFSFAQTPWGNVINLTQGGFVNYSLAGRWPAPGKNVTIEFWVKSDNRSQHGFFDIGRILYGNNNSFGIFNNLNSVISEIRNGSSYMTQSAVWNFTNEQWNHVAVVLEYYDSNCLYQKTYLNNRYVGQTSACSFNPDLTKDMRIGWTNWYGYSYSYFDEFKIYDYAKTTSEIYNDYYDMADATNQSYEQITCSINADCGTDAFVGDKFCSSGDVYQNWKVWICSLPGSSTSSCLSWNTTKLVTDCTSNQYCSNGQCSNPACSTDADCGTNGYIGDNFCSNGDVYKVKRTYTCQSPGTANATCTSNDTNELQQDCSANQVCADGSCVNINCNNNLDCGTDSWTGDPSCNGNDVYQNYRSYVCNNPGTASSSCSYSDTNTQKQACNANQVCTNGACVDANIQCSSNSDCGTDGFTGSNTVCNGNEIWQDYRIYTCSNPGTISSSCSYSDTSMKKQLCGANQVCSSGACVDIAIQCSSNSQCGTDGFVGSTSCNGNNVYQDYRTYTCSNPGTPSSSCSSSDTSMLKESCTDLCNSGMCIDTSNCIMPADNMYITSNTVFCKGTYYLPDGMYVSGDSVNLDCNGAVLKGNNSGSGITVTRNDVTIKNCIIQNYNYGIFLYGYNPIHNSTLLNNKFINDVQGIRGWHSYYNLISNNEILDSTTGIFLHDTRRSYFADNTIKNTSTGFHIWWNSNENEFVDNTVSDSSNGIAFYFDWIADYNLFVGNKVYNMDGAFAHSSNWYGTIYNNTFIANDIENNRYGFSLGASQNAIIKNNLIANNQNGIFLTNSANNTVYSNDIINNNVQASDDTSNNAWDYGNYGNHWSNYDEPSEGCIDSDSNGICDSSYIIGNGDGIDNFALTSFNSGSVECNSNSDCGAEGYFGSTFCSGNSVYQNYVSYTCKNAGTISAYCSSSETNKQKQLCGANQVCSNGACADILCKSNSDCGTDGWIGSSSCTGNSIYQNYRTYICSNPGTISSSCSYSESSQLKQTCGANQVCSNGACISVNCFSNADCGASGYFGAQFCSGNDIYQNYKRYTCVNPGTVSAYCSSANEQKLQSSCSSNQKCVNDNCYNLLQIYRLYNGPIYDHFYTNSASERDYAITLGYNFESNHFKCFESQAPGTVPLYRLYYGGTAQDHFYTADANEKDFAINKIGFSYEGVLCYVYPSQQTGTVPLYRLYYGSYAQDHFYTVDASEKDYAANTIGFSYEGIAGYVYR